MLTNLGIQHISDAGVCTYRDESILFQLSGVPVTGESPIMDAKFPQ